MQPRRPPNAVPPCIEEQRFRSGCPSPLPPHPASLREPVNGSFSRTLCQELRASHFQAPWLREAKTCRGASKQEDGGGWGGKGLYPRLTELGGFAPREPGPQRGLQRKGTPRRRDVGFLSLVEFVPSRAILLATEASHEVDPPAPINLDWGQRSRGPLHPHMSQSQENKSSKSFA